MRNDNENDNDKNVVGKGKGGGGGCYSKIPKLDVIYCVNLEASKERKVLMKKQFERMGMKGTFLVAVHPRSKIYLNCYRNIGKVDLGLGHKCYCPDGCEHKKRKLRPTEIAISLSHYHVYRKMLKHKHRWALVVEDDVVFHKHFGEILSEIVGLDLWETEEPVIIFCGGMDNRNLVQHVHVGEFWLNELPSGFYSNYCYFLNLAACKKLLKYFFPISRPEDSYKRWLISLGKIKSYRVTPSIVGELSAGRNLDPKFKRLSLFESPNVNSDDMLELYRREVQQMTRATERKVRVFSHGGTIKGVKIKPSSVEKRAELVIGGMTNLNQFDINVKKAILERQAKRIAKGKGIGSKGNWEIRKKGEGGGGGGKTKAEIWHKEKKKGMVSGRPKRRGL